MTEPRYQAKQGADGHGCCYKARVIDTTMPTGFEKRPYETVCECWNMDDAMKIARALNRDADDDRN